MMWRALSRVCGSRVRRMISSALRIGASGLRSSWARVARNSSLLRSALRSASSTDLRRGHVDDRAEHARRRVAVAVDRAVHLDPVDAAVGPDHAALEVPVAPGLERGLEARLDDLAVLGMDVGEEDLRVPFRHRLAVAEALVVAQRVARLEGGEVEVPVADAGRIEHEAQVGAAFAQRRLDPLAVGHVADDREVADRRAVGVVQPADRWPRRGSARRRASRCSGVAAADAAPRQLLGRPLRAPRRSASAPRTGRSRSGRARPTSSCRSAPRRPGSGRSGGRRRRRRRPRPPSAPARPCAAGSSWRRRSRGCRSGCRRRARRPRRCGSPKACPRPPASCARSSAFSRAAGASLRSLTPAARRAPKVEALQQPLGARHVADQPPLGQRAAS